MGRITYMPFIFLVLACFVELRCFDDSSKDKPPAAVYDFKITKVDCTAVVYLGHPVDVNVTMTSNDDVENVPVDFTLAERLADDAANNDKQVQSYSAGSYIIPTVARGENTYTMRITVPTHTIPAGQYDLVAVMDPGHVLSKERDECVISGDIQTDRAKECITADMRKEVTVSINYMNTPDLLVEDMVLTSDVVIYEAGNTNPDFITGTVTVKSVAQGALNVPVRFIIEMGGVDYPVMIWDSDIGGYVNDYLVGEMRANVSKSFSFALAIDTTIAANLGSGANSANLKAVIDPDNQITEAYIAGMSGGETNNVLVKPVTIVNSIARNQADRDRCLSSPDVTGAGGPCARSMPRSSGPGLGFSKSYSQMLGSTMFGANPNFLAWGTLDENGAAGYTGGSVDIYIFNSSFSIASFRAEAAAVPHMISSSYVDIYLGYIGTTLYSFHQDGEYSWEKKWEIYKSRGYTARFFVGPIPLNVSAGAQGTLGFGVSFTVGDNLEVSAGPYVYAGGYASASVGIAGLLEAGVVGNLSLLNVEFKGTTTAGMQLSEGAKQIQGWLNEQVVLNIAGPNGNIQLFAQHPWLNWCKWWWTWYPCGYSIKRYEYTLFSFSSWSKSYTLLDLTQTMPWIDTGL